MEVEQTGERGSEGGGRRAAGRGSQLFDKVSSATAHGMTMTQAREGGNRVKDTMAAPSQRHKAERGLRRSASTAPVEPLDASAHFSPSRVGEYKSAD